MALISKIGFQFGRSSPRSTSPLLQNTAEIAVRATEDLAGTAPIADLPDPNDVPLLPVEITLEYTYDEPFGTAEVSYIVPAGRPYILASGEEILNDDLQPGMRIILKDGAVATVTGVEHHFEPPGPPVRTSDGRLLSRVVGQIKHKGFSTVDVSWPGSTATSSPDHLYYSVTREEYVGAAELQVGEFLRTEGNLLTPVVSVSKPQFGMVDLYNVEVEHYHNYHVGEPGSSVLVHNSASPGDYINTPAERKTLGQRLPESEGSWVSGTPGEGVWRSTDRRVRRGVAKPGEAIPDHVDVTFQKGFPVFEGEIQSVHGVKGATKISLDTDAKVGLRTRSDRDFAAANRWLAEQLNQQGVLAPDGKAWSVTKVKKFLKQKEMQWHHHEDMTSMQLLRKDYHDNIAHLGGRSLKDFSFSPPLPIRKPK